MAGVATLVVLLCGVTAAVVLGKAGPVLVAVSGDFGISLSGLGWLASGVTAVAALVSVPLGRWIGRRDLGRSLAASLAVLGIAGLASSVAGSGWLLFGSRIAEGVGFVGTMLSGPALLSRISARPAAVLALWAACVPVGLALASVAGGALDWRLWFALVAVVPLALAAVVGRAVPKLVGSAPEASRPRGAVWLLSVGFMLFAAPGVALVSVLPVFLASRYDMSQQAAGAAVALVAAASILGNLFAAALLRWRVPTVWLFPAAAGMPLAVAAGFGGGPVWLVVAAGASCLVLNGVAASAGFAAVPEVAGSPAATAAGVGVLTQLGSVGTLLGAPVLATVADHAGWWATVPTVAVAALGGTGCAMLATRRAPGNRFPGAVR